VHTFVVESWNNKSPHEITFIKENINEVFIKRITHVYSNPNGKELIINYLLR
jgi:hypothetical protein